MSICGSVIDSCNQDIFKRYSLASIERKSAAGFQKAGDVPSFINRDQPISHTVCRSVQGYGQIRNYRFIRETLDSRHHAGSRKCDSPGWEPKALLVGHQLHGFYDIVIIVQRLSHAHYYDIELL